MRTGLSALVSLLVVVAPSLALSQSPSQSPAPSPDVARTPQATATAFLDAVGAERWLDAARLLDLGAFEGYRQMQLRHYQSLRETRAITVEDLLRAKPDMPRAAAEYQVKEMNQFSFDRGRAIASEFARVTSVDSLGALSTAEAAARWLEASDERHAVRELARRRGCPVPGPGELKIAQRYVVASAVGRDSVAYVVLRERGEMTRAEMFGSVPTLVRMIRVEGAWRIVPERGMARTVGLTAAPCEPPRPVPVMPAPAAPATSTPLAPAPRRP